MCKNDPKKKAVVLLSGGLDSVTCLALAVKEGFEAHAITFDYGQRHKIELICAERAARSLGAVYHKISFRLGVEEASALTSTTREIPDYIPGDHGVPSTYVPARNLLFLSFATAFAESIGSKDIFIGVNSIDYSGYPDCRKAFIDSFAETARLGTKACDENWKFTIHTPLQNLRKKEIIELGLGLGVDYSLTRSCYNPLPGGIACGKCDSCGLRMEAFRLLGLEDPALTIKIE